MTPFLLQSEGTSERLRLLDVPALWIVVLIIVPAFAFVAWIGYAREGLRPGLRTVLVGLRLAAFALLLLVLARPVRVEQREDVFPPEVLVLVDDSASMSRRDVYSGDESEAEALSRIAGRPAAEATRLELVRGALERGILPHLASEEYRVRLYSFGENLVPIESADAVTGRGAGTHLGDALTRAVAAHRGRHVTDAIVLSDGRQNGGLPLDDAARSAAAAGIPVHTVVVGDTRPERNAVVELIEAPSGALEGDELSVTVRVSGRGVLDAPSVSVVLEELDPGGGEPRVLADDEVELTEDGERVALVAPPALVDLRSGERRFRVSVSPLVGETMVDDNAASFAVHVSPARVRVLYVDGYPRWEYRYLKNLLLRSDARFEVQCYLLSATPDFPQESSLGLPPLGDVPATRLELLENYDVVILGDVNPYAVSADPARCEAFLVALRDFVEAGGGLLFQAGEFDNPRAYQQTPLEDVLPVQLDPAGVLAFEGDTTVEFRPRLEHPKRPHEIVRLHADPEVNRVLWEEAEGLRGFYWYSPIHRAKAGTQVLLRHPRDRTAEGEPYPLLVTGYFPSGRTLFLGVDSTWMWRFHYGWKYHERFWRNAIRWLALGRLKSGDRRFRLETGRSTYDLEDRISIEARVLDEDFRPSRQASQDVRFGPADGEAEDVELDAVSGRPGVYRTALSVDRPGSYRAWIEDANGKRLSTAEFEVRLPSRENANPAPDPAALASLARITGGTARTLGDLEGLTDELPGGEERREPISSRLEDAWDRLATLLVALGLLAAEWSLRKRAELV